MAFELPEIRGFRVRWPALRPYRSEPHVWLFYPPSGNGRRRRPIGSKLSARIAHGIDASQAATFVRLLVAVDRQLLL